MGFVARPSVNTGVVSDDAEVGFSLQDIARQDLLWAYHKVRKHQKILTDEKVKFNGSVRIKTALEALNDLYFFIDEFQVKNDLWYKRKELNPLKFFTLGYYEKQLKILVDYQARGLTKIPVASNGFSLYHYRRWKLLCRLGIEISGITKFERKQELSAEFAFAAGAQ